MVQKDIAKYSLILGGINIVLGAAYLICTIIFNSKVGSPSALTFVGCLPLLVVGILGVITGLKKNRGVLIATLVVAIITCIILAIGAVVLGIAVGAVATCNAISSGDCTNQIETEVALLRSFVAFCVLGLLATLGASIVGCMGTCCRKDEAGAGTV